MSISPIKYLTKNTKNMQKTAQKLLLKQLKSLYNLGPGKVFLKMIKSIGKDSHI